MKSILFMYSVILIAVIYRIYKDHVITPIEKEKNEKWVDNLIENIPEIEETETEF